MNHEKLPKGIVAGLLATSVLTGCTTEQPRPTITETKEHSIPCDPSTLHALSEIALAQSCADEYRSSSVAFINYSLDTASAEGLAATFERDISTVTDGIVSVDVTVVTPSDTARQAFIAAGSERCVADNISALGSYIADKAMPELTAYDKIIAESDSEACTEGVGAATDTIGGRYIDLFDSLPDKNDPGNKFPQRFTIFHESLHLYGLRHAGTLTNRETHIGNYGENGSNTNLVRLNLNQYIQDTEYSEYGDTFSCNVMSNGCVGPNPDENRRLNAIQKNQLRLPEILSDPNVVKNEKIVDTDNLHLDGSAPEDTFATVKIKESLRLPNLVDGDPLNTAETPFDKIHFLPIIWNESGDTPELAGVEVYLSGIAQYNDAHHLGLNTVALGQLVRDETLDTNSYELLINEQTIAVTFTNSGVEIAAK